MIELRDIIDLFHMSNNNSIIIVDNCETFEYGEDDITDKLSHIVDLIDFIKYELKEKIQKVFEDYADELKAELKDLGVDYE